MTSTPCDITYIIVTWNNQNEIRNCLDSIKKYSPETVKTIVVDNASSDDTVKIIKEEYKDVILISSKKNLGFAKANNLALGKVKTNYICFINPDVILTEDIVSPSIDYFKKNLDAGIVACKLKNKDGSLQPSCFEFANSKNLYNEILHKGRFAPQSVCKRKYINYYQAKNTISVPWVIGAELVMRTDDVKRIGGFSTEYYMYTEDMDLCRKVRAFLYKQVIYMPEHSLIHLGGTSEAQNFKYDKQRKLFENDLLFVNKFDGKNEKEKTLKAMIKAYKKRNFLVRHFYSKDDKQIILDKGEKSLGVLEEIQANKNQVNEKGSSI